MAIALVGFSLGIAAFIFAFTTAMAGRNHLRNALLALSPLVVFGTMAVVLNLHYPQGLLQQFITLPRWLG